MAISLATEYPGQIDTDAAYPYGKPRNRSAPSSTDGTPLEKLWMQDVHGFLQHILIRDGTTPSGTPDSASLSEYGDAIWRVKSGYTFAVWTGGKIAIASGGLLDVEAGADLEVDGDIEIENGGEINVNAGGEINLGDASELNAEDGSITGYASGSTFNLYTGATFHSYTSSLVDIDGVLNIGAIGSITMEDGSSITLNGATNYPVLSERSEWIACDWMVSFSDDADWSEYNGVGVWDIEDSTPKQAAHAYWRVKVPAHYTISKVKIRWAGPAHSTWPPENRTLFAVYKITSGGAKTLLAEQADTSDQPTYEGNHELEVNSFSATFTETEYMLIEMWTESGTNAEMHGILCAAAMYATFTELKNC